MSNSEMVESLIKRGYILTDKVKQAMLAVDRKFFTPPKVHPYYDMPYPVGHGQTISAPSVVTFMIEHLDLEPGMKVLEVGSGSGYNTAILSYLAGPEGKIVSIEVVPELNKLAEINLEKAGFTENVELCLGDGSCGYEKEAPYDRVIVTAAMPYLDKDHPLIVQLKNDGKIVAPVGNRYSQEIIVYDKKTNSQKSVLPVIFVPLIGRYGFK